MNSATHNPALAVAGGPRRRPVVSNPVLGTLLFIFAEAMFFSGLISTLLVVRAHEAVWPPVGQPRLPVESTGLNTLALLLSAFTMWRSRSALKKGQRSLFLQWLGATLLLGATFLAAQGFEWVRLVGFGLTTTSSIYGSIFYVLIGAHGVHVLGALVTLYLVFRKARANGYSAESHAGLSAMTLFWFFVVGIWPALYLLVYVW